MIGAICEGLPQVSVNEVCRILDYPRSTYYYAPTGRDETAFIDAVEQVLLRYPFYGYRRVWAQLTRQGLAVGQQRVRKVLKALGITRRVGQVRVQTTDSKHPHWRFPNRIRGLTPTRPNQVWVADITYIRLGTRFIYLAVVLDAYSRAVRGWCVSRHLTQDITLSATRMALESGTPAIFHSDQGSQYAAWLHTDLLGRAGVHISMSDTGKPQQNGIVERFMRTLKEEHVDYTEYAHFDDACSQLAHWLQIEYNTNRIHSALGYATPAEFEGASASLS
jgi:putative transposase